MIYEKIVILVVISTIGLIFVSSKPILGTFVLIFLRLIFENPPNLLFFDTKFLNYSFGAIFILLCIFFKLRRQDYIVLLVPCKFYYIFLIASLFSLINLDVFTLTSIKDFFVIFLKLLTMVVLFTLFFNFAKDEQICYKLIKYFVYVSIPLVAFGWLQFFTGKADHFSNYWGTEYSRVFSTFSHPNQFAFFLSIIVFCLLLLIDKKIMYYKSILYLILIIATIVLTYSRAVWFSLGTCLFLYFLLNIQHNKKLLLLLIVFIITLSPIIKTGMKDLFSPAPGQHTSLDMRFEISSILTKVTITDNPFMGFGLGSSSLLVKRFTGYDLPPHNDYVRIFVESGLLGLFSFLAFIISLFLPLLKRGINFLKETTIQIYFLIIIYLAVIIIGTNHLGNVSTMGIWFCFLALVYKINYYKFFDNENTII